MIYKKQEIEMEIVITKRNLLLDIVMNMNVSMKKLSLYPMYKIKKVM